MAIIEGIKKWVSGYEDDEQLEEVQPRQKVDYNNDYAYMQQEAKKNKVVNINATTQLAVVLVKPEKFENSAEIADNLKERRTIVLNLESADKENARRILDFLSGVAYANSGKIERVANNTFIITPYNVDILGGDLMGELENSGLYV